MTVSRRPARKVPVGGATTAASRSTTTALPSSMLPRIETPFISTLASPPASLRWTATSTESPTLISVPVDGVSIVTSGLSLSSPLTPPDPPRVPVPPNGEVAVCESHAAAAAKAATSGGRRRKLDRMSAPKGATSRSTTVHARRRLTLVHDVGGDQDQEIAPDLVAARDTEQLAEEGQVHEDRDAALRHADARLREATHHRGLAVGDQHLVIDA